MKLVGSLQSYKMEPLIVFSFSRRDCEAYSLACANPDMGALCFANSDEAQAIEEVGDCPMIVVLLGYCNHHKHHRLDTTGLHPSPLL